MPVEPTLRIPRPYLLFLGAETSPPHAKTAFGLRDWAPEHCLAEYALPGATVSTGLPRLSPGEAHHRGARSLVIGVAQSGGAIEPAWVPVLCEALEAGLDIVSGMHARLEEIPDVAVVARRCHRRLVNVREPPRGLPTGTGRKRPGLRLLTVGTDCALGKKYTALSLTREFRRRGLNAEFRATGQTGILIAGSGIPIDAVVADFVSGAAEVLTPDAAPDHWDLVEGQGSLFHPAFAAVSLGLLHGTQPDVIVMAHQHGRERISSLPSYATPAIPEAIELTLALGRRTNPQVRCAGLSLNTATLDESHARRLLAEHRARLGLPVADPMRPGPELDALVSSCLSDP